MSEETSPPAADDSPPAPPKRNRLIRLARSVLLIYLVLLGFLWFFEPQLVYPGAYVELRDNTPMKPVQAFRYPAEDGSVITGRLLDRPASKRTVLFFHGNGVRANALDAWLIRLSETLDANVLAAEYRGYQIEDITPQESNVTSDAVAAHDALISHFGIPPEQLVVYGRSLGGACAAAVAQQRDVRTLVLDRTFDSMVNVAAGKYPMFPIRLLMRNRYDSVARLSEFGGRLIQIHGDSDGVVPLRSGVALHQAVPSKDKHFLEIPGMGHNDRMSDALLGELRRLVEATSK